MEERFPLGLDVEAYLDKALEALRETYPWAERQQFRKERRYAIEETADGPRFVTYFRWSDGSVEREVLDCDAGKFIETVISQNRDWIEDANPETERFDVPLRGGIDAHGWLFEQYTFAKHELGGYSVTVTAGNRSAGGSRTFFIPPEFFAGSYDDFLAQYAELVPAYAFGLDTEYLAETEGLRAFLGF